MTSPADDFDVKPEKIEEDEKEGGTFHCDLYDMDIAHKIAQEFLPGLASACVDNTTGGLFSSPASVAVDIRREMVDYLVQRSENFVAESVVLEAGPNEEISKDPYDIISDFIDDFASSKRNFFSRVSGWLLSEKREDKIDDFVQEMEINGFWLLNRRESIAQTLLKNVDFKNLYHCSMSFKSPEELANHKSTCSFRTMTCTNEGCNSLFSAAQKDNHDSVCPFKILKCEQNCSESIMRREMDRHCITVCPMKLVKCPFSSVGCQSSISQSTVGQHRSENLSSHLIYILQVIHKEASASVDDLKERAEELIQLSSPGQLAAVRDARALTHTVKGLEAKLGPLKVKPKSTDEASDSTDGKEESSGSLTKEAKSGGESPSAKEESASSPSKSSDGEDHSSQEKEKLVEEVPTNVVDKSHSDAPNNESSVELLSVQDSKEGESEKASDEKVKEEHVTSPGKAEQHTSVAALELQPTDNENSVFAEENLKESSASGKDEDQAATKAEEEEKELNSVFAEENLKESSASGEDEDQVATKVEEEEKESNSVFAEENLKESSASEKEEDQAATTKAEEEEEESNSVFAEENLNESSASEKEEDQAATTKAEEEESNSVFAEENLKESSASEKEEDQAATTKAEEEELNSVFAEENLKESSVSGKDEDQAVTKAEEEEKESSSSKSSESEGESAEVGKGEQSSSPIKEEEQRSLDGASAAEDENKTAAAEDDN